MKDFPKLFEGHYSYLLQEVLESIDDAVLVFTGDQAIVYVNQAAEDVFSGCTEKIAGENIRKLIPKDNVSQFEAIVAGLKASKSHSVELKDKKEFVGIRGETHFHAEGKLAKLKKEEAYMLVLRDITWKKTIEDELEVALDHLRKVGSKVAYRIEHPRIMDEFPLD